MGDSTDLFSLANKTALVTGSNGYLGTEMSRSLAEAGACVLLNGRDLKKVEAFADELINEGLSAEPVVFDVTSTDEIAAFFQSRKTLCLDVLVNNAYQPTSGSIETGNDQDYRDSYEIGLVSVHGVFNAALSALRKARNANGDASVINIASMYGMVSPDMRIYSSKKTSNPPFYGAAKAGLIQWSKYAACEFGSEGIRVNSISPGAFPAPGVLAENPELVRNIEQKVPLGRIGLAAELKGPVLFLASSASSYVTGSNIVVDGGWTAW